MAWISYSPQPDSDDEVGIFDTDDAESFLSTKNPWQVLYLSTEGAWILNVVDKGRSVYQQVNAAQAKRWLEAHGEPETASKHFPQPRGGRPRKGLKVETRLPEKDVNYISTLMAAWGEDQPEVVRRLVMAGILSYRVAESLAARGAHGTERALVERRLREEARRGQRRIADLETGNITLASD